ncbi:formate/nitrite transporter [Caldanaerovirga acetigignens]|uniref:Formate/nitrite transporter n=1 Tax=Caldanaerovirga acetigignens TaxID=447595 RepID=A0A1M7GX40_9FIRM|nr:formate/nitrite transporter family protein [Caldanaerovirga acetigignens]SHM20972.1 formate/nitrite transporter [Caldanaerovirga acetigignens]
MEKRFLAPKEIIEATIAAGKKKAGLTFLQMLLLGLLAGVYIGFGGFASITIMQTLKNIDTGLMKFAGAMVFPVGLMLVVICGAELFTGNNLMVFSLLRKEIDGRRLLRNWITVYVANFVGSVLLAFLIAKGGYLQGSVKELTLSVGQNKLFSDFTTPLVRGILCNVLVVLAVMMATSSQDIISKIFSCWFPIMLFVLSGYEHSVANMFFIPLAKFGGMNVGWGEIFAKNLIPVTLGNIIGGAIVVPLFYFTAYFVEEQNRDFKI